MGSAAASRWIGQGWVESGVLCVCAQVGTHLAFPTSHEGYSHFLPWRGGSNPSDDIPAHQCSPQTLAIFV